MSLKRDILTTLLPYLPNSLLPKALHGRTYIIPDVPAGREFVWPYYLGDTSVLVNTSNPLERAALTGTYDPEVSRHVRRFVRPGDVCVDGGANVGLVTLLLARAVGSEGRVYAVEPGEVYRERLIRNLQLNPRLGGVVRVAPVGLSDSEGTLRWAPDPRTPYNAAFLCSCEEADGVSLPVTTLDLLARGEHLTRLDFIKLDLEGMELPAFRGAREVLERFRPAVLFESMEIFRNARGCTDAFRNISSLLAGVGYGLHHLTEEGALRSVTPERMPDNTLALHRDDPRLSMT